MPEEKLKSIKNKKQYEALRNQGMSKEKAARIANSDSSGQSKKYEERSKEDLYQQAKKIGIERRSKMSKKELIQALRDA